MFLKTYFLFIFKNMETIFNGQMDFNSNDELDVVLNNLNPQMSIRIIEVALEKAQENGCFNLVESHCIYQCVNFLKKKHKYG
jgi:hypothetical protein